MVIELSWVAFLAIGGLIGGAMAYPMGQSAGRKPYEDAKERLRQALLNRLPAVPTFPEWVDLPSIIDWLQRAPNEEVLKWAIQALNMVIDRWSEFSEFVAALLDSLKEAFQVTPTAMLSPRLARKAAGRIVAKPFKPVTKTVLV